MLLQKHFVILHLLVEFAVIAYTDKLQIEKLDLEDMIKLFEFVISPSDRIVTGAIYTPSKIRKRILENCFGNQQDLSSIRVADIACGCGGFLMDVAKYIHKKTGKSYHHIYQENIYGIDIQSFSIERCKILLNLLAISEGESKDFEFNLLNTDTLSANSTSKCKITKCFCKSTPLVLRNSIFFLVSH